MQLSLLQIYFCIFTMFEFVFLYDLPYFVYCLSNLPYTDNRWADCRCCQATTSGLVDCKPGFIRKFFYNDVLYQLKYNQHYTEAPCNQNKHSKNQYFSCSSSNFTFPVFSLKIILCVFTFWYTMLHESKKTKT